MRVFLAGLFHETNTFSGTTTRAADFRITRGADLLAERGNGSPIDGFLSAAAGYGWEVIPGIDCRAHPSGMPDDSVFERYWAELKPMLGAAISGGLDAIFLILHGAMATPNYPDVEGVLLERIRSVPGAERLPVFAVLDLHANVSPLMARHASALIPYRENPHTDARETAVRAARLLWRALTSGPVPCTHFLSSRMLLAPPSTGTSLSPMRDLAACARDLEVSAGHWEIGVAAGFAHADTPDTGLSFWVVSDRPEPCCRRSLETMLSLAQGFVGEICSPEIPLPRAVAEIARDRKFPALIVEPSDNIGGGASGNTRFVLRELLRSGIDGCGVIIADSEAVASLLDKEPGQKVEVALGAGGNLFDPAPLLLSGVLLRSTDGRFRLEDPQSHLASLCGLQVDMGLSALLRCGNVLMALTTIPTPPFDLGQWRSLGVDPETLNVIAVKAAVGHRRAYDRIAASSYTVDTPGPCSSDLKALPYRKIRRPIWPLDQ